ncbi:discoidin domain-containing protein, partial [Akkermansiaceae bacterium]|nr:discoidin domain-containing protein [Akkermansiaceae bacterium]
GTGSAELVDGITGDPENLKSDWLGFEGEDLVATIDFGKTILVEELGLSSCQVTSAGVFLPPTVEFSVSLNGKDFKSVATTTTEVPKKKSVDTRILSTKIKEVKARHLRVHAKNLGTIPDWHQAKGRKAWLFIDEILVNPQRSRKNHR